MKPLEGLRTGTVGSGIARAAKMRARTPPKLTATLAA
jgi:hypothetical protein